ncbi:sarcosine oxidase subunit gamma [Acetobacter sp.]|jgi:sarcosine oxidase subunit gamma|uniref:sarcosine oxidase subunit gamma n=1 Tax=Acetobacter sp. TaxID=440 RepID=UPI0025C27858|nr:sarcosine oxidase subunit gamma family protein [Acetobacter sp.]MCH4092034.1 sarcosine oxidase subunit gamma [Acetobacter sp.]MCI1300711.1 sarcosine oxidase subunit gamma [Acetobacter sp.]MCI1317536.1 sarcosine oxidase subunit gamma [Acetobacter sp.]
MADQLLPVLPVKYGSLRVGGMTFEQSPLAETVSLGAFSGDGRDALVNRIHEAFGVMLPEHPRAVHTMDGRCAFLWNGPSQWLAIAEDGAGLLSRLREVCEDVCALTSQSDSRAILKLSGPDSREAASRLVPIDLHPRAFGKDHVASTLAGHIPVIMWQTDDVPTYLFLVFRSLAASLFHDFSVVLNGFSSSEMDTCV